MSGEITNVVKLSPVTVVKAEKQTDDRGFANARIEKNPGDAVAPAVEGVTSGLSRSAQEEEKKNQSKPSLALVKEAADHGNELLQAVKRNLQFKVDESTNELVVKVVDSDTGEVVRQIPSDEMLAFIKRMQELQGHQGAVIQDRA